MNYTATFSNGKTINRNSKATYTHAWMVTWVKDGLQCCDYGFAGSEELARKAATPNLPYGTCKGMNAKQKAQAEKLNAEFLAGCNLRTEIIALN